LIAKILIVFAVIRGLDAFRVFDIIFGLTNGGPADATLDITATGYPAATVRMAHPRTP
jgi:multiple sugar transport system permease protein